MNKIIHGDYQTPAAFALEIAGFVKSRLSFSPHLVVEPNCGEGAFVLAAMVQFKKSTVQGFELDGSKLDTLRDSALLPKRVALTEANFFDVDWAANLAGEGCLVLGNPPWVAASRLGELDSDNRPTVKLELGHSGIEHKTGESNYDIAEYMALALCKELAGKARGALAFLVKASTARRLAIHLQRSRATDVEFYRIEGKKHFGVSVACGLVLVQFQTAGTEAQYREYSTLSDGAAARTLTIRAGHLIAPARPDLAFISGQKWRSGVKHDAADILELAPSNGVLINKQGTAAGLPSAAVFPFIKSSDLAKGVVSPHRRLIVPPGGFLSYSAAAYVPTEALMAYLVKNANYFDRRKSAVYSDKDRFSVFGVGAYSFKPWKVAISAFSKTPVFHIVPPHEGRPVLFDDTVYFVSFDTEAEAGVAFARLTGNSYLAALSERMFIDDMRPVKAKMLNDMFCLK